jgi:motility quorum-sensing regulator/GCU-specific mRNA interferase toxin
MDKRTPHTKLAVVKDLVKLGKVAATRKAQETAAEVGIYVLDEMCEVILRLSMKDFHKSMTTHADHREWQDVYHGETLDGTPLYVKLMLRDGVLIVSFKEL